MAGVTTEAVKADALMSRIPLLVPEDVSYSTQSSMEIPMRYKNEYPTTSTANSSYYQSSSTTMTLGFPPTSLTTIIISRTATITLTTTTLITSESTIITVPPPSAPLLSSKPANTILPPSKIAGIVIGAIVGLLLFVALFYLLLTRAKWLAIFAQYRLEREEEKHRKKELRPRKRAKKPAEVVGRYSQNVGIASHGKRAVPSTTAGVRPASTPLVPEQRQRQSNERRKAREAERRRVDKPRDGVHSIGNRR